MTSTIPVHLFAELWNTETDDLVENIAYAGPFEFDPSNRMLTRHLATVLATGRRELPDEPLVDGVHEARLWVTLVAPEHRDDITEECVVRALAKVTVSGGVIVGAKVTRFNLPGESSVETGSVQNLGKWVNSARDLVTGEIDVEQYHQMHSEPWADLSESVETIRVRLDGDAAHASGDLILVGETEFDFDPTNETITDDLIGLLSQFADSTGITGTLPARFYVVPAEATHDERMTWIVEQVVMAYTGDVTFVDGVVVGVTVRSHNVSTDFAPPMASPSTWASDVTTMMDLVRSGEDEAAEQHFAATQIA